MSREWLDALDLEIASLTAAWALAPDLSPEDSAATVESVADRLRELAAEARRWDVGYDDAAA